jgi:hypothetical protein
VAVPQVRGSGEPFQSSLMGFSGWQLGGARATEGANPQVESRGAAKT